MGLVMCTVLVADEAMLQDGWEMTSNLMADQVPFIQDGKK